MMGMSPRLASLNSGGADDANGPHSGVAIDENMMNSSCKDTMKMADRREFSFFESVNREFVNANAMGGPYAGGSMGQSKNIPVGGGNHFESINIG